MFHDVGEIVRDSHFSLTVIMNCELTSILFPLGIKGTCGDIASILGVF